jgi:phosphomannomutase/phosphoglucomutase
MKSSLPGYLEYSTSYGKQPATAEPQQTAGKAPARLSKARAILLLVTLVLAAESAFLIFQLMYSYLVISPYVARTIDQETDTTTEQYATPLADIVDHYGASATRLANDPDTVKLFIAGDDAAMRAREKSLRQEFPKALNVQLLPPGLVSVNMASFPPLSYAALDQIRLSETSTEVPLMEVHLFDSPQQHVNIIRRVINPASNNVVGHIRLSLPYEILQGILDDPGYIQGYIELQQAGAIGDPIVLAARGDINNRTGDAIRVVPIAGSRWQVAYWTPASRLVYLFSLNVPLLCVFLLVPTGLMLFIVMLFRRLVHDAISTIDSYSAAQSESYDDLPQEHP